MIGGKLSGINPSKALGVILDLGSKSTPPSINAVDTISENNEIEVKINNYNAAQKYQINVPVGTITTTHPYIWSLPYVTADTDYIITISTTAYGELPSALSSHTVTVTEGIQAVDIAITDPLTTSLTLDGVGEIA